MDIAELGYKIDSSGLVEGTKALDQTAEAAERAGGAAERLERDFQAMARQAEQSSRALGGQESRYRSIAQQAIAWAESNRSANLSERALAEAAREAALGIDVKAQAMSRAGNEQERMVARARALQEAEARAANEAREAARAAAAQELNLKQLLGQINPTVAALNRLADQEDRLTRARDLGLIKPQVFEQYRARLESARAATLRAGAASDDMTRSIGRLNLNTIEAQQSVAILGRSLVSGDWAQAQSSITSLTARTGALGAVFSATGLAITGVAAALVGFASAAYASDKELDSYSAALISTGGAAGMTAGQLRDLADTLGKTTGRYGEAQKAVQALAASGKLTGDSLSNAARAAVDLATLTGQSIESAAKQMEDVAASPSRALLELNNKYNFLTASVYEHVRALEEQGRETEAVAAATAYTAQEFQKRTEAMKEQTQQLTGLVVTLREEWQSFANDLNHIAAPTLEIDIAETERKLANLRAGGFAGFFTDRGEAIATLERRLADLREEKQAQDDLARGEAYAASLRKEGVDAYVQISSVLDRAKSSSDKLEESTRRLVQQYKALQVENPDSDLLRGVVFGADGSVSGGTFDKALAQLKKESLKGQAKPRANTDDNSAQSLIANIQRQITANEQLAESGSKVTASDRMVIQARQLLADKTNTMTGATRELLKSLIPTLETTDAQAQAEVERQRGMQASIALTERLAQIEKQRQEQADVDLLGIGMGTDEKEILQRKLDIQRQYLREQEKLDRSYNSDRTSLSEEALAVRKAQYEEDTAKLAASLNNSLEIERNYQQRRLAGLQDWRSGFTHAWRDYVFAAANASDQAAGLLTNGLSQAEAAFVQFVKTGKLSFRDLADTIIAELARIAAKQMITGLFGGAMSWLFGSKAGISSTYSAQSFGNNTGWLTDGLSFGGGRARGGPVSRGSFYEVGEHGRPEIYQQGGKNYLIPGNDGQVVPIPAVSAGVPASSGPMQVQINNYGSNQVTTREERQRMPDGSEFKKLVIDIVGESLDGGALGAIGRQRYGWTEAIQ